MKVDGNIQNVLNQMRAISSRLENNVIPTVTPSSEEGVTVEFSDALKNALNKVNEVQNQADKLKTAFVSGDESVNLVDVTLATQKSSLAFEAAVQVRNRLVSAYKEIMNMPI